MTRFDCGDNSGRSERGLSNFINFNVNLLLFINLNSHFIYSFILVKVANSDNSAVKSLNLVTGKLRLDEKEFYII